MIKRNVEIKVRLSRKEAETLNKRVKKSGISREAYIRQSTPSEKTSIRSRRKPMC